MAIKNCGQTSITKLITLIKEALTGKANSNHSHGNLTNDGKIGTTANLPLFTGSGGIVSTKTAADARTSLEAMGIGSDNGAVGTKYTTTIEPDTAEKKASVIRIKDNASGNTRAFMAVSEDTSLGNTSQISLRNSSNTGRIVIQSNDLGKKGLRIIDENGFTRVDISHNVNGDTCVFQINDASGNDITLDAIGAAPLKQWKDSTEAGASLNDYIKSGIYTFSHVAEANGDYRIYDLPELDYSWIPTDTITLFVGQFTQENDSNARTLIQFMASSNGSFYRWANYITDEETLSGADPYYEFAPWIQFLDMYTHPRDIGALTSNSETVTLTSDGWSNNEQTVATVSLTQWTLPSGITTGDVIISPAPASMSAYIAGSVYCSEQYAQGLKFKCEAVPSEDITVNVLILK